MKTRLMLIMAGVLACVGLGTFQASGVLEVGVGVQIHAVGDFEGPLAAQGGWEVHGSYGRCWRPAHVEVEWRPYCDGEWVWTDAGWYWQSDEPWAWACYHYGRWFYDDGWFWIPDVEWAPAWVYWRTGGGHTGWAPCPPHGRTVIDANFVFVDNAHFQDHHRPSTVIINNVNIIHGTKLITKVSRSTRTIAGVGRQKVVINNGPGVAVVQKAAGKKFAPVPIHEAAGRVQMPQHEQPKAAAPQHLEQAQPAHAAPQSPPQARPAEPPPQGGPDRGQGGGNNGGDHGDHGGGDHGGGHDKQDH